MKPHYYESFRMSQKELCEVCAPISFGRTKDVIRSQCQVPTCPMVCNSKSGDWSPVTLRIRDSIVSARCWVDYPKTGSTSMIIHTDKIRFD